MTEGSSVPLPSASSASDIHMKLTTKMFHPKTSQMTNKSQITNKPHVKFLVWMFTGGPLSSCLHPALAKGTHIVSFRGGSGI